MPPRAVLLDLYDTVADSDWYVWRDLSAGHVGLDPRVLGRAFTDTRPARSVGTYADEEADVIAVLEAAGLVHDPAQRKEPAGSRPRWSATVRTTPARRSPSSGCTTSSTRCCCR